jgi:hypothetical protein
MDINQDIIPNNDKGVEIKLGGQRGGTVLVDADDFEKLNKHKWYKDKDNYVCGTVNGKTVIMHRFIMSPAKGEFVDHINHVRSDNRKSNLRKTTIFVNNANKLKAKGKSSQYRNVHYDKKREVYQAQMIVNGKGNNLGSAKNETDAAKLVDMFIIHNKLDHIELNFPENREMYLKEVYVPSKESEKVNAYSGVRKQGNKFAALVCVNNQVTHIGFANTEILCAKKYDSYIVANKILRKKLNFPENYPEYDTRPIKTLFKIIDDSTIELVTSHGDIGILIDKKDYDIIKYYACHIEKKDGYVKMSKDKHCMFMHRVLMNVTDPLVFVDHIDNNPLNNKRDNLRLSNALKNGQNKSKSKTANTTSQYMGVSACKKKGKPCGFKSKIKKNGKEIFASYGKDELVVAHKRDLYILFHLKDDHYKLNFNWTEEEIQKWKEHYSFE